MGQKQGLNLIIDVARRLQDVNGHSIKLVLCGEGAMKNEIKAASVGLECITWLPLQPVERLNDLLNLADIHLLPQKADAADLVMPSKLTNMLASGKPVIATAHEGTELYSIVKQCGRVTEPGNVESFLSALVELANDPLSRMNYGLNAREYAITHLSKYQILDKFEMELQTLFLNGS
jgi:colanic acid biosynthesis glycosyl transferase WcaI